MTVLGALRRSIENPQVPISSAGIVEWAWGKPSGQVSESRAYGISAFYRAVALNAGVLAQLPLKVYKRGSRERVTQQTILDSPSRRLTPFEWRQVLLSHALTWGNGFAMKRRNFADQVVRADLVHPSRVRVEDAEETDRNPEGKDFVVRMRNGSEQVFTAWDVMHLPYMAIDGTCGLPPLRLAQTLLGIGVNAEDTASKLFSEGMRVQGFLTTKDELDPDQAERLQNRWTERTAGVAHAGKVVVLDNGGEFKPLTLPPQDAELLATRQFTPSEIARLFGVPPHLLAEVDKSTSWGTGIEQQFISWVQVTLQQWMTLVEQRFTRELLPGGWTSGSWFCEHAVEGLLRGDSAARSAFYHQAITDGWMSRSDVRTRENLPPADGLDDFLLPSNLTLIKDGEVLPLAAAGQPVTGPNT